MYDGKLAVVRHMRVSVRVCRRAMRSPSRVTDSGTARQHTALGDLFTQTSYLAGGLDHPDAVAYLYGHAGRVISSVLQLSQAVK